MIWDEVMRDVIVPLLETDAALVAALDGEPRIFAAGSNIPVTVPSVEWMLIGNRITEVFEEVEVQFDVFARDMSAAVTIERRVRAVCHRETRRQIAGLDLSTLYDEGYMHRYPEPGIVHRSLRFRFEPVRHRYVRSEPVAS